MRVRVDMCIHYYWQEGAKCHRGRKASLKCHSERLACPDYQPSWHYPARDAERMEGGED